MKEHKNVTYKIESKLSIASLALSSSVSCGSLRCSVNYLVLRGHT